MAGVDLTRVELLVSNDGTNYQEPLNFTDVIGEYTVETWAFASEDALALPAARYIKWQSVTGGGGATDSTLTLKQYFMKR